MIYSEIKCRDMNCDHCPLNGEICHSIDHNLDATLGQIADLYAHCLKNRMTFEYHPSDTTTAPPLTPQELAQLAFIEEVKKHK